MIKIYDIETLSQCHTYSDIDREGNNLVQFVIHKDRNDLIPYIAHLKILSGQIGFNSLNFDGQVIQYILENYYRFIKLDGDTIAREIYQYAQKTIEKMNKGGWADYPEWKMMIKQLDLFKIWHFDNKAKMTSWT